MLENYVLEEFMKECIHEIEDGPNHWDFSGIVDCFNFVTESVAWNDGYILLLDGESNILAKISENSSAGYNLNVYQRINLELDIPMQNRHFELENNEFEIWIFTEKVLSSNGHKYYFVAITLRTGNIAEKLDYIKLQTEKMIHIFNKLCNNNMLMFRALDSISDGISFCNEEGKLVYINKAGCSILGMNRAEMLNFQAAKHFNEKPALMHVLENKKSIIDREYWLTHNGTPIGLISSGYPVINDDGSAAGAIDIFRGIERSRDLANKLAGHNALYTFDNILGENKLLIELIEMAKKYAYNNENILIFGESGTGKELIAQSIHNYSPRNARPFIAINCANFPNELIDSELFGYESGAFTGAAKYGKPGKFELANGGTLFLDEIGEMQIHLQAKLLRVLETMCIDRISGTKPIPVNVRIIAATNRNLHDMVEEGKFRKDLYYRLKVLYLELPSLRERGNDVLLLADYYIKKISLKMGRNIILSSEAKELLMNYSWPGNIRELENTISRLLYINNENTIDAKALLSMGVMESENQYSFERNTVSINAKLLQETLNSCDGNKKKAAEKLGISRPTIYKLIKKYKLRR